MIPAMSFIRIMKYKLGNLIQIYFSGYSIIIDEKNETYIITNFSVRNKFELKPHV